MGLNPGHVPSAEILLFFPWEAMVRFSFLALMCTDSVHRVLPTREANLSTDIHGFYYSLVVRLATQEADLQSPSPSEARLAQVPPIPQSHC